MNFLDQLNSLLGDPKDDEEREARIKAATDYLEKQSNAAGLTIDRPSVAETRALRKGEVEDFENIQGINLKTRAAEIPLVVDARGQFQDQNTDAYGKQRSAAADAAIRTLAPGYAELERSGKQSSDDLRYLTDKEFADRATAREIQKQALEQRKGDRIFDMIKTLGIGGALLLS